MSEDQKIKQPKVSMAVAVYKSEPFLPKLLDSIENQTYKNIEPILVDDGSPDNSGAICDRYAAKDERIHVIHQENQGTCAARNAGLKAATGDYVLIIDGDDWLETDYVEYLLKIALDTYSDMSFSYNVFTTRDRQQIENDKIETWSSERATAAIIYPYLKLGPWNKLYSLPMLRKYNIDFSVPWFGEGLYFACTASQHANHVGVGYRKVYNYRLNNTGSGLSTYSVQKGLNALQNIRTIKKQLVIKTPMVMNAVNWHLWKNYTFLLLQIVACDAKKEYQKEYKDCLNYIRTHSKGVLKNSDVNRHEKIKIILCWIAPVTYSKIVIKKNTTEQKRDTMK